MSEDALRSYVREALGPWGVLHRVENAVDVGTPDLAYVLRAGIQKSAPVASGWIELKHATRWPARPTTPLVIEHLTLDQVLFAERWARAGGWCWALLQVGREYLLLDPPTLRGLFERRFRGRDIEAAATAVGPTRLPVGTVLRALTGGMG